MLEAGEDTVDLHGQVERLKRRVAQLERNDAIHQKTIEASPDVTFRFDPEALCNYVSPAIADVLGYTPEEHVGSSGFAIIHPDEQHLAQQLRERLLPAMPGTGSDRFGPVLSRLRHKGGHFVWVETMVVIIRDPDTGVVQEFVLTARDVNARVEAEAALRVSEERSTAMLDNLQVGVVVQGARSEMLRYNEIALDMLGLTAEQIEGRDSFDSRWAVIHEDGSPMPGDQHPVVVAITTGKPVREVVMGVYRPASDSRVWLLVSATPQFDKSGRAFQTVCTFTNITAQKQAEVLIREQKELLERMSSPTIPIAAGVVVLPLIGQFDAGRAERVLDGVLSGVALHTARVVILDITGVSTADAAFASSLLQISRAVRLLGAEVVVTGMTPSIAQILVGLGIDFRGLVTRGTLQDGVAFALGR
ncbi:PAS domain S-box protein [Nannocystis bainbridge]|uniref:PAS domain S-box protein n=1 Tax=Nannocystis bainbridge TaxID=2995303 RepID=A0ABT5EC19_9BACT|nr:PAS domain S-box protein [Nannocystis bainbridge]MDC0723428.1 PAS domain S-box protein [Nannocystis bainbridge]